MSAAPGAEAALRLRPAEMLQPWMLVAGALLAAFAVGNALLSLGGARGLEDAAIHGIVGVAVVLALVTAFRCHVECDGAGLHFRSGAPWPLSIVLAGWDAAWSDIRAARWVEGVAPAILELDTAGGTRRLMALRWQLDAAEARRARGAMAQFRRGRTESFDATTLPLVHALRERGIDVPAEIRAEDGAAGFELTRNPSTMAALLVAAFAAGFWLLDWSLSSQVYGRNEPWSLIGACAAAIACLFAAVQSRAGVPLGVNVAASALVAAAGALACHGALLRANQLADVEGRSVEFTLAQDGTLVSNAAGVPDLPPGFFDDPDYWAQQKAGSTHGFVHHRGLGFDTLDVREYRARVKAFHARGPAGGIAHP